VSEDFAGHDIFERANAIKEAEMATVRKFDAPLDIVMHTPEEYEAGSSPVPSFAREGEVVYRA